MIQLLISLVNSKLIDFIYTKMLDILQLPIPMEVLENVPVSNIINVRYITASYSYGGFGKRSCI